MAAVTICSDFEAPKNKVSHCFPICLLVYSNFLLFYDSVFEGGMVLRICPRRNWQICASFAFFFVTLGVKLYCLFEIFFVPLGRLLLLQKVLILLFLHLMDVGMLYFHFDLSSGNILFLLWFHHWPNSCSKECGSGTTCLFHMHLRRMYFLLGKQIPHHCVAWGAWM